MDKIKITNGVFWVEIPEENLYILCGCPADVVKHLMIRGFIVPKMKNGISYETGPNAILLSDVSIQNGQFSNLAEFPILQMLYRQGMILPGHPNNTGEKPILIGHPIQVTAQSEYLLRGNYGLTSLDEILETGISRDIAEAMFKLKLKFAFDKIKKTEELIDFRAVESSPVEIKNDVTVKRKGLNIYEFKYKDISLTVDLSLGKGEEYKPPVNLDYHHINREYFSVIHIGEGDGWDVTKPCMSSIINFQGKFYLIDTGPNILQSLIALGISVNEIEGIFHTHAHDDHFAGLTSLVRSDHKINYYATPLVRASISKKLSALMSISKQRFENTFIIHDLQFDEWNNINGLEVMPIFSPHPVENSIMFFRAFWEGGYKTYAHFADIPSLKVLDSVLLKESESNPAAKMLYERFKTSLLLPVNEKKIDIGGGMIHGEAADFSKDQSLKIILSHTSRELTPQEKEIGSNATFGQEDILIKSNKDYYMQSAYVFLREYFPKAPVFDLDMLLNCSVITCGVGEIIIKKGDENRHIYLILGGVAEYIDSEKKVSYKLSPGSFLGEISALFREPSRRTYRAVSYIKVLKIPIEIYNEFISRNVNQEELKRIYEIISFLQSTELFGEMVSSLIQYWIAKKIVIESVQPGDSLIQADNPRIILLKSGEAQIYAENKYIDFLLPGDFFGEEEFLIGSSNIFTAVAKTSAEIMAIPIEALKNIPIIEWKMLETFEKHLQAFGTFIL